MPMAPLHHLVDDRVRRLARYWLDKRRGRAVPARRDIDPVEIPWALANIWIAEHAPEAADMRYRLAGTTIDAMFGRSLRGQLFGDILPPDRHAVALDRCRTVLERPAIAHLIGPIRLEHDREIESEGVILPLTGHNGACSVLLGFTVLADGAWGITLRSDSHLATTFTPVADLRD